MQYHEDSASHHSNDREKAKRKAFAEGIVRRLVDLGFEIEEARRIMDEALPSHVLLAIKVVTANLPRITTALVEESGGNVRKMQCADNAALGLLLVCENFYRDRENASFVSPGPWENVERALWALDITLPEGLGELAGPAALAGAGEALAIIRRRPELLAKLARVELDEHAAFAALGNGSRPH